MKDKIYSKYHCVDLLRCSCFKVKVKIAVVLTNCKWIIKYAICLCFSSHSEVNRNKKGSPL